MRSQIIHALALLPALALAAPSVEVEKRAPEQVDERAQNCCGAYICDTLDFTGNCYWACYEWTKKIVPDPYFQQNAGSFGPDVGCECFPYTIDGTGGCLESTDGKDITQNPGGNLGNCINNLGYFHCNPTS